MGKLYSVKQVAETVGKPEAFVRRAIKKGRLAAQKVGWNLVIGEKDLIQFEDYVRRNNTEAEREFGE